MKILFIDHYYGKHLGGGEEYLLTAAEGLKELGYDVYVLALPSGCLSQVARKKGLKIIEADFFSKNLYKDIAEVEKVISEIRPDLVNTHGYYSGIIGRIAAKKLGIKNIVCTVHTEVIPFYAGIYHKIRNLIERVTSGNVIYIAVSKTIYRQLTQVGIDPKKITIIHPAYDEALIPPKNRKIKDRMVFGAIGRLESVKGFDILIRAFSKIRTECPSAFLYIYGDGSQRKFLEKLIQKLRMEDAIFLKGYRPAQEIFDSIDVLVSSSLSEGFPLALLNAARLGIPCICTRAGGQTEIIKNNEMGIIVEPGSENSLKEALLFSSKNYVKLLELAEKAKNSITDEFSPKNLVKKHDELFKMVVNTKSQRL